MQSLRVARNLQMSVLAIGITLATIIPSAILAEENRDNSFTEEDVRDLFWKGIDEAKAGRFPATQNELEKLLDTDPAFLPTKMCLEVIKEVSSNKINKEEAIRLFNSFDYTSDDEINQKAIPELNKVVTNSPKSSLVYCFRGLFYYGAKKFDEAIADFNQAIQKNPRNSSAYHGLADTYKARSEYDQAIVNYSQAIKLEPKNAWVYHSHAELLAKKGQYQEAISDYTIAINLRPQNPWFYLHRGSAYKKISQHEKALADYIKVTDMYGDDFYWVFRRQANLYKKLGCREEAEKAMEAYKQRYYFRRAMPGGQLADIEDKIEDILEEEDE